MQTIIGNINFLLDIKTAKLTDQMFQLPYTFAIPDLTYYEELIDEHQDLVGNGLRVLPLSSDSMSYSDIISKRYKSIGIYDIYALTLAKQEKFPIITYDNIMTTIANNEAIVSLTSSWLVNELKKYK